MAPVPPPVEAYEKAARLYCEIKGVDPDAPFGLKPIPTWQFQAMQMQDDDIRRMALERERVVWPPDPGDPWG